MNASVKLLRERPRRLAAGLLLGLALPLAVGAQVNIPREIRQGETTYNLQSQRGVPISTSVNTNIGSDGRMTTTNESSGSLSLPTTNQFKGFISFGSVPGLSYSNMLAVSNSVLLQTGSVTGFTETALQMKLPLALTNASQAIVLRRSNVGAPFFGRQVSYPFGAVVEPPTTDENGLPLSNVVNTAYWLAEPYTTNGHAAAAYYYSPHAGKVYAIQPGPAVITWVRATPLGTSVPTSGVAGVNYYLSGGTYYRLYSQTYSISSASAKTPRKLYWTEDVFADLGEPVAIPSARIGDIKIVYNNAFPQYVATEYPGDSTPGSNTNTLWYNRALGGLYAYNVEGRVFVELLGDAQDGAGTVREQLGFEIVDVLKRPTAADVTVELGDRLLPPTAARLDDLVPSPVDPAAIPAFAFSHNLGGRTALYATRETQNENDYLVTWLEEGVAGLLWPAELGRYRMVWPADPARYSHYIRPPAATDAEARQTAIQLPTINAPVLEYQDPLDTQRGKLTDQFAYYTWLTPAYPAHRALIRYNSGDFVAFERVFSWLDSALLSTQPVNTNTPNVVTIGGLDGSVATNVSGYSTNGTITWADELTAPRVVRAEAPVGQRIDPPVGEPTLVNTNLQPAGHLRQAVGTSFNPAAYKDPFVLGLEAASRGAIIPVNAIPGSNQLQVWWYRPNGANAQQGFTNIYWPSAVGYYTTTWPTNSREIVLASRQGSAGAGPMTSLEAAGSIYVQNNPLLPGYNPNEEHAIMSGGTAFATRDDLNITNGAGYSSQPFVLVDYTEADGRPAMAAFRVLREKPSAGWVFDYVTTAGTLLQAPMPLPLLGKPILGVGSSATNFNTEPTGGNGDLPGNWLTSGGAGSAFAHYARFTYEDRHGDFWVYRGLHAGLPALQAGRFDTNTLTFGALPGATAIVNNAFSFTIHASRQDENLGLSSTNLPAWLTISGLSVGGTPALAQAGTSSVRLVVSDLYDGTRVTNTLVLVVLTNGVASSQGALTIASSNGYTGAVTLYSNRPPFLALSPNASNSFTMQFYYKTTADFAFPGWSNPPPAGSIVPYLSRPAGGTVSVAGVSYPAPLSVVYRPVWPVLDGTTPLPVMPYGLTLAKPQLGLPGVRDWKTARVLYQQSVAADLTARRDSVVLFDPTVEKFASLSSASLTAIPSGVRTELYQGRSYFPDLPPHLSDRLFFDPARGPDGQLVLQGVFQDEIFGSDYFLLNVLRGSDLQAVLDLCPSNAAERSGWNTLVNGLHANVLTYLESPTQEGVYSPVPALTWGAFVQSLVLISNENSAVDSCALSATGPGSGYVTLVENGGGAFTEEGDPVALHVIKVGGSQLAGEVKVLPSSNPLSEYVTFQHKPDLAGRTDEFEYEWRIGAPVDGLPPATNLTMSNYQLLTTGTNLPFYLLGGAGIQVLGDNYLVMRYRPVNTNHPFYGQWSDWTSPQLAEGWIKRVLAGINPFNQRTSDLFNNAVNTDVSILQQAGTRWEGAVALNADSINDYGLIEIYETVLRRGRAISIESGYNYGPANDALLLAAGYLNDLYMMLGSEAWADAANPTIGIGTADNTYGDIATALFAFKGQTASLLDEELALLRGRDDFLLPGVATAPVYNRLVWNYTRGIDAGEVVYALNYNILDGPGDDADGVVNAEDAARVYPQGHGDAYGHYLTALKGYYSLFMDTDFDWVPRAEAVSVLGQPVSVDYQDERKFASAAVALGRAGQQVLDLTWRKDYEPNHTDGWSHLSATRANTSRPVPTTRYWGVDHWAARTGLGNYLNWVVGNAILPAVDPNPNHEGIQKIDRTTVPELTELASMAADLQTAMNKAEGGLTPLGIPEGGLALDINPNAVVGVEGGTHFEQIYGRAKTALNNAVAAFDDAKDVTRLMRSEQDSLSTLQTAVASQESSYENALIELYGTPYTDDIGVGKTYAQGYDGPDLLHFMYTDNAQLNYPGFLPNYEREYRIDIQGFATNYNSATNKNTFDFITPALYTSGQAYLYDSYLHYVPFTLNSSGDFQKPSTWLGQRASPGRLQEAIARIQLARNAALGSLSGHEDLKRRLDRSIEFFDAKLAVEEELHEWDVERAAILTAIEGTVFAAKMAKLGLDTFGQRLDDAALTALQAIPNSTIVGAAVGGDTFSAARAAILANFGIAKAANGVLNFAKELATGASQVSRNGYTRLREATFVGPLLRDLDNQKAVLELDEKLVEVQQSIFTINQRMQELDDAIRNYRSLVAKGNRLQEERRVFRQNTASVVQGYRTRDAAFRLFRNEKLERYKTLFDLSARYALLAANAYDYETGLLDSTDGRSFIKKIVAARALGVVENGEPQFAGSSTGDPGLSSALAEMKADWDVVKGRLGFNNPDAYGTTVSLRTENFRILPTTNSLSSWMDVLQQNRMRDILQDEDVRRYCRQVSRGSGLPVPGIVIEFSTTIENGANLFGQQLAAGDHAFSPSAFATKIFGVGVSLEGYRGMDAPAANSGVSTNSSGDPDSWYLDPLALSATPYVYLVPVGVDSMRAPPLGDTGDIRSFTVADVAIPLPFNIGASAFADGGEYLSADSLSEPLFGTRMHQAFRPVPSASYFNSSLYGSGGSLVRSQYMNNRLIGRSVWNSRWKLVIPGHTLLNDPDEGLDRFIQTVRDIKINFVTYSYSGN